MTVNIAMDEAKGRSRPRSEVNDFLCEREKNGVIVGCGKEWKLPVILGFDHAAQSTTSSELSSDRCMHGAAGLHDIIQNAVDRVLVKDAEISVCVEIHF